MALTPTTAATRFALELEGQFAGIVTSAEIGTIKAVTNAVTLTPEVKKPVGYLAYGDSTIVAHIGEGPQLTWISSFWRKQLVEKSGAIIVADMNFKERRRANFAGAMITEVKLDDLDARNNKSPYSVTCTFGSERLQFETSTGAVVSGVLPARTKAWSPANFRIKMGGLPCERVVKVSGLTATAQAVEGRVPSLRMPTRHASALTFGDLTLEIAGDDTTFSEWNKFAQQALQDGVIMEEEELVGVIEWLDPTMKNVLGTLTLLGCYLKEFSFPSVSDAGAATFTAVFGVEQYGNEGLVLNKG